MTGKKKLRLFLRSGGGPVVAAYLFFAFFPHVQAVTHTHANGEMPHTHPLLSTHDASLRLSILTAMGENGIAPDLKTEPVSAPGVKLPPLEHNARGLHAPQPFTHTHFVEDPNLLSLSVTPVFMLLLSAMPLTRATRLPGVPALPGMRASARGPPMFSC